MVERPRSGSSSHASGPGLSAKGALAVSADADVFREHGVTSGESSKEGMGCEKTLASSGTAPGPAQRLRALSSA